MTDWVLGGPSPCPQDPKPVGSAPVDHSGPRALRRGETPERGSLQRAFRGQGLGEMTVALPTAASPERAEELSSAWAAGGARGCHLMLAAGGTESRPRTKVLPLPHNLTTASG